MILLRCDASSELGQGHVRRCLEVARELSRHDQVMFACAPDPANRLILDAGYPTLCRRDGEHEESFLLRLASERAPRALVLDTKHPYSSSLIQQLKAAGGGTPALTVIVGNLCEGLRHCDLAAFPSAHEDENLLLSHLGEVGLASALHGISYVIIRTAVREAKTHAHRKTHSAPRLVVTTGGSDPRGVMLRLLRIFERLEASLEVSFLMGSTFAHRGELEGLRPDLPPHLSIRPYSLSEVASATAVVCTFGVSLYEMIYLGVPTICVSHSQENARYAGILQQRHPVFIDLGFIDDLEAAKLQAGLQRVLSDPPSCSGFAGRAASIIDGNGAARIAGRILELCS